ncbi:MAG: hypothetical protein KBF36_04025 [Chitinophagaceae bacterium]|nr:hypothetical protein [Chitinophagaceae bacterium]
MNISYINEVVSSLNYSWFLKKKEFFLKESFYDAKADEITFEISNPNFNPKEPEEEKEYFEIKFDLNEYCWVSYFEGCLHSALGETHEWYYEIPDDAKEAANKVVDFISFSTSKYTETKAIHKFILKVIDTITEELKSLNSSTDDIVYSNFLIYFSSKTRKEISKKFGHIAQQISFLESSDYLEFNLTQDQLAALLLILNKAGFINSTDFNDTRFLHFCAAHFKFKIKGTYKTPNDFKALSKKYSAIKNDDNTKAIPEVVTRLKNAFKEL